MTKTKITVTIIIAIALVVVSCRIKGTYMVRAPDVDSYGVPTGYYDYYRDSKKSLVTRHGPSRATVKRGARFLYVTPVGRLALLLPMKVGKEIPNHKISLIISSSCGGPIFADCEWRADIDLSSIFIVISAEKNELLNRLSRCDSLSVQVLTGKSLFKHYDF